ncbi:Hsp70 family protein [Amycolatopsis samaneae]|uniref:Hsp70 family protein n=1 Tax=Amycolatopsis samaneae TaxID=664691 RepID=A0ABW5G8G1_9PSEU
MRETIDFGIDLGTTNSAIAVAADHGAVSIVKSVGDEREITPSAVWIPKRDQVFVGVRARERVERDPANAAAEFKQDMGLADAGRPFERAGVTLTPQQLSAEVLKSLRGNVVARLGESPGCAVITVPAAFTLDQRRATTDAAELAGFDLECPLVQEPTAAAFAYGLDNSTEDAHWMVFDFGGGTFDAAVVSKRDGELRVLNHAGDLHLGGKQIDWALAERVLAPAAADALGFAGFRRDNPKWRANFATLKGLAEQAKIQLSVQYETVIMDELLDEHGSSETFEYTLRRDRLDAIAEPYYARAVDLCRDALAEAMLDAGDIDRLLLVGGATLAPGLRERLADPRHGLGIELDIGLDPTTVVARGAAIFASTIRRPRTGAPAPAPGEFAVSLVYDPRVSTRTTSVAGTLHSSSTVDWSGYAVTLANPGGVPSFRSARTPVNRTGAFVTEVDVDPHRTSRFTIELTDGTGARCALTPDSLSITHGETEFGGVTLEHSLGIQLHDRLFAPVLAKGTPLPKARTERFVTAEALRRADTEAMIRIPVVQGERRRGDRNREVGMLQIRPRDLRIDLPQGSDIEVTFEMNASSLVTVSAEVPLLDALFEARIDMSGLRTQAPEVLEVMLIDTQRRRDSLRGESAKSPDAGRRMAELERKDPFAVAREQVRVSKVDPSAAKDAEDRLRDIQAELDEVEDAVRLTELVQELQDLLNEAAQLVGQAGSPADRQELDALNGRARDAIRSQDAAAVRTQIDRGTAFVIELERRTPDWPVKVFYSLVARVGTAPGAGPLVDAGKRAIGAGDQRALTEVNRQLFGLIPPEKRDGTIGVVQKR